MTAGDWVVLSKWERDVVHAAAMIQVDRHMSPMGPIKTNPDMADRWREIADAIQMGRRAGPLSGERR